MALAWCWGRRTVEESEEQGRQEFCVYVLWMNAHTFLITTRALAVAVMMEGKVASAEARKQID